MGLSSSTSKNEASRDKDLSCLYIYIGIYIYYTYIYCFYMFLLWRIFGTWYFFPERRPPGLPTTVPTSVHPVCHRQIRRSSSKGRRQMPRRCQQRSTPVVVDLGWKFWAVWGRTNPMHCVMRYRVVQAKKNYTIILYHQGLLPHGPRCQLLTCELS